MRFKEIHSYTHPQLLCILFFLSYLFLMFGNGVLSLTHPDEVFYIQSAKEMLQHHSWDTPYIFDAPQFEKPILAYWLFMLSIKAFGLNSFAARFAPAVFGILAVSLIYGLSWVLFKNKRLSFLSGLILMSSFIHLALSRAVLTDMIFSVWVTLSIAAFYWGYENQKYKDTAIFLSLGFCGVAILTKGILGFCFPAGTILLFLLLKKDLRFLFTLSTLTGLILLLAIALPWHITMYKRYGGPFIHEYFQNVHIRRLFEAEHERSNKWYFYPMTVIGGLMPWSVFLLGAIGTLIQELKAKGKNFQPFLFLVCWMIGIFVFVQPAHSKLASYILPIFPAFVITLAYYLEQVIAQGEVSKLFIGFKRAAYVLAGILGVTVIAVLIAAFKFKKYIPTMGPVFFLGLLFIALALGIILNVKRKNILSAILGIPAITATLVLVASFAISVAEPWVSCKQISEELKKIDHSNTIILSSKFFVRGVRYYTDRSVAVIDINGQQFFSPHPIPFLNSNAKVKDFLAAQPVTFCIVKKSNVQDLERIAKETGFVFTQILQSGDKYIVKIQSAQR